MNSSIGRTRPAMMSLRLPRSNVVELDGADGAGAGGVDCGEYEYQPG